MKSEVKRNPDATVEIAVMLESAEMQPYLELAALKISRDKEIAGFRPGKAPLDVVKNAVGEMRLYEEAVAFTIDGVVPKIIRYEKLRVVGRPEISVKKIAPENPLEFTLKTAIVPDFTLPNIESIAKKILSSKTPPKVTAEEIGRAIEWLRKSRAVRRPVERPAASGDHVEIDFKSEADGIKMEHGSSQNHPLKIGDGKFVAGFEDNLIGMSKGDSKKFEITMPGDYHEKSLAGKTVDFDVTMKHIEEEELPELSYEFAKSVGKFATVAELKSNIESGILEEKKEKERERVRISIADAIADKTEIAVAKTLIESELDKMTGELKANIEGMNLKFEDYLAHIKKTEADLRKDWAGDAKRRVKIALILGKIAEEKEIVPTPDEIKEEINRTLEKYPNAETAEKDIDPEALATFARSVARNEKVFRYLESIVP